jgi:hypothetical protein
MGQIDCSASPRAPPKSPPIVSVKYIWWQTHASDFKVLARIARKVLAIPVVSISVERLFSSGKHTLSDSRSSLTAESAMLVMVKFGSVQFRPGFR